MVRVVWATAEAARARRTANDFMANKRKKGGEEKGMDKQRGEGSLAGNGR